MSFSQDQRVHIMLWTLHKALRLGLLVTWGTKLAAHPSKISAAIARAQMRDTPA